MIAILYRRPHHKTVPLSSGSNILLIDCTNITYLIQSDRYKKFEFYIQKIQKGTLTMIKQIYIE